MPIKLDEMTPAAHPVAKPAVLLGAGGKELPEPYKWVHCIFSLYRKPNARSTGNEALDTMAFLHLLEQLKVCSGYLLTELYQLTRCRSKNAQDGSGKV